jgi:hypothetical protein
VEVNKAMANHPSVLVLHNVQIDSSISYSMSILGLLNGLCGLREDDTGHISVVKNEESGDILGFFLTSQPETYPEAEHERHGQAAAMNIVWDKLLELGLDTDCQEANQVKEAMEEIAEALGLPDDY